MYWIVKDYSVHNTGTSREDDESYAKLFLLGFTFGSFPKLQDHRMAIRHMLMSN